MTDAQPTEADYPFDPKLENRIHELTGRDRVRAIRDRRLAQLCLETYPEPPTMEKARIWR